MAALPGPWKTAWSGGNCSAPQSATMAKVEGAAPPRRRRPRARSVRIRVAMGQGRTQHRFVSQLGHLRGAKLG
jgi:hypothetical protein